MPADKLLNMKLVIHQGYTGLQKIEPEWNKLFNHLSLPVYSQSIIWHKAYLQHLVADMQQCYYFCIYKDDNLVAIFPLEAARHKFYLLTFNALVFSENSHFGLNSILADEREETQSLFEFLYHALKKQKSIKWDLIYLERVIENSQAAACKTHSASLSAQSVSSVCDVLPIQPYEKTLEHLSRNFKGNLRKSRKKISKIDHVKYETSNKETLITSFEHFLNIEASGWKGSTGEGSAIKLNDNLRNFYQTAMAGFAESGQMEINWLSIADTPIAVQYAIILEPTVYLLKIGYNEDNRSLSPGNLLIEHKLKEYETNQNLSTLNLISDASRHTHWKPTILSAHNLFNCRSLPIALYIKSILWLKDRARGLIRKLKGNNH